LGDVGDQVGISFNGILADQTRLGVNATPLHAEANASKVDPGNPARGIPDSTASVYGSARANAGQVGASIFLDWVYPVDSWGAVAWAYTADTVQVSNPGLANQTVSVLVNAAASGGLSVAGAAADADARAFLNFGGIAGLAPYLGADSPYFYYENPTNTGTAEIFSDRGYQQIYDFDSNGNAIYRTIYDYSPRWTTWAVDVMLDGNGNGTFSTLLSLVVSAGEDGTCHTSCRQETGVGASDYSHTVVGWYSALDANTNVNSVAGWTAPVSSVPMPPTFWLMLLGLGALVGVTRRKSPGGSEQVKTNALAQLLMPRTPDTCARPWL